MASYVYDTGRNAFLNGLLTWNTGPITVALVGSAYTPVSSTDQYFSTVSTSGGVIGTPVALTGMSSSAGVANASPVTTATIATGSTITGIVIYNNTGTTTTSQLIAYESVTSTPTNGGTITLTWDTGVNKIFKL